MSLIEAVLSIADELEAESKDREQWSDTALSAFKSYAKQLRTAVKAASGSEAKPQPGSFLIGTDPTSAAAQNAAMIEQARADLRKARELSGVKETLEPRMVQAVGGESDADFVTVEHDMPIGAKTMLPGGQVYVLQADGLHFSEVDTKEVREIQEQKQKNGSKLILSE